VELNHDRRGSGEPLVLVHGIGSHWQAFEPVLDRLARERDVIALDLPGFGESEPLPSGTPPDIDALTTSVERFIDALGVDQPHVAGFSLGGRITLELAKRDRVRSATAICPAGFWLPREAKWSRAQLRLSAWAARTFGDQLVPLLRTAAGRTLAMSSLIVQPWRMTPEAAIADMRALASSRGFQPTLEAVAHEPFALDAPLRAPVTIAWGDRDQILLSRQAPRAVRVTGARRFVQLRRAGHVPFWDDPDGVVDAVLGD
jgi:pimeloyl-ACP methyl ester carboxylesterase